jgi:excisionase family DNA binding protein
MIVAFGVVDVIRAGCLGLVPMPSTVHDPDELIKPLEAAYLAGVSVRTLSRYVNEGRLAAVRTPGGRYRYRRSDIMRLTTPTTAA